MTAVIGTVVGLQSVLIAGTFDVLRDEMDRGFDRLEARIERLEGRGPPASAGSDRSAAGAGEQLGTAQTADRRVEQLDRVEGG